MLTVKWRRCIKTQIWHLVGDAWAICGSRAAGAQMYFGGKDRKADIPKEDKVCRHCRKKETSV